MQTLQTQRLELRAWRMDDFEDFYGYAQNPNIGPNAGWEPHTDRDASRALLQSFIKADETWAMVWKESGRVIGSIGLHPDGKRSGCNVRMIGYVLAQEYWGKGIMPEGVKRVLQHSFEDLALDAVSICHFPFNLKSKRVIEKCGFTYEGTFRKAAKIYDGTVLDEVCYSMLREEYDALYPQEDRV